ncbi:phage tail spike protein [Staphylococcus sp. IVB6227]|uniref:phage tail spike protein n=1 Tax=Staphylococcus sp. IVB6227 TaxID=2989768 RepID=UPI0021CFD013|nr:phage tail spike protein [Staphylococcus sp. IVB6227]UXR77626.1 hypothetical protein MUA92_07005 [Staphylococcus sp. IVB6227]
MIHVLNYSGQIIDFFSQDDSSIIKAMYSRTSESETLELIVLSSRGVPFKERNRILIQDKNENYREFIVDHVGDSGQYIEVECTASYLVDISSSKPIPAGKYEKMTVNQKLSETLRDSGWTVGDCDYAGIKTNSWTSVRTPLEMISQLETAHDVVADYEIIIDGYEVVKRLVNMRKPTPLFKGKEIEYGKDLLSMKRTVDFSEVKTALFAFGPENENGKRISLVVHDDEAQQQLGLPQRYIWGIYEPETLEDNMTRQRLETLARTELNKHKSAAISYEVSIVNIEQEYPHETIRFGDLVRIKNTDFTPSLYAESEVIGFDLDLISGDCTYQFGKIVEFKESDLRRYFESKLGYIQQKLNDNLTNVNTIVRDSLDSELQFFERKIFKGETAPDNPVNDTMWLDTSNPNVAVLRRYFNGEWHNATAEKASDVGAITREQALYSELTNAFTNLTIQHAKLLKEVLGVLNSEFFVSTTLKANVQNNLDETITVYNKIKTNLDSMTSETATIGKLIDTQSFFLEYREKLQSLYTSVETAKRAINARFKLLQSQYTDAKFNDAMNKVASSIPGGNWDSANQVLTSEVPNEARINEIVASITESAVESLQNSVNEVGEKLNTVNGDLIERINNERVNIRQYVDTVNLNLRDEVTNKLKLTKDELSNSINAVKEDVINDVADPLKIRMTTAESGLQQLQDSLLLSATKTEVNRLLTDALTPLKTDVNNQKAQLKVMSDSIDSKVSKSDYTTDKNGIVRRLNNADSAREQLANQISDRVTLSVFNNGIDNSKQYADDKVEALQIGNVNLIRSFKHKIGWNGGNVESDYATRLSQGKTIHFYMYEDSAEQLEPNTDYVLQLHEADEGIIMAVVSDFGKNVIQRYTTDRIIKFNTQGHQNFRMSFLAKADNQLVGKISLYKGTKALDWTPNPLDIQSNIESAEQNAKGYADKLKTDQEKVLTTYDTRISQNGQKIQQRATKQEYNASKKLLDKTLAEIVTSVTSGVALTYESNGAVSDFTLNSQGISLNSQLININDGDVIVQNGRTTIKDAYIDKLFSKTAFIENLKAVDIDFNRASAYGNNGSSYLKIVSDKIELSGTYDRTWRGIRSTRQIKTELFDGGINFINSVDNRSLWFSDFGVSTFKDGDGEGTSSGTLSFFDTTYSVNNARGVTLVSNTGVVALETRTSAQDILLKSSGNVQVTTVGVLKVSQGAGDGYTESHILMPRETTNLYAGFENEFRFTNREFYNDGNTIYNRFRGSIGFVHGLQVNSSGANPGTNLYLGSLNGEVQVVRDVTSSRKVYGNARMSGLYVDELIPHSYSSIIMRTGIDVRGNILLPSNEQIRTSGGYLTLRAGNGFVFIQTNYEARIVKPGTTNNYMPIRFSEWHSMSHEKYKHDIKEWDYKVLDIFKNDLKLHKYKVKNDLDTQYDRYRHGIIIRYDSSKETFPVEWRNGDGFDGNEVLWWNTKAIQELATENDQLKKQLSDMQVKLQMILEMIK